MNSNTFNEYESTRVQVLLFYHRVSTPITEPIRPSPVLQRLGGGIDTGAITENPGNSSANRKTRRIIESGRRFW